MADDKNKPDRRQEALKFVLAEATPGNPKSVLDTLDRFATEHEFLMNVGPEKGPWLAAAIEALPPGSRVLELGGYCGYSATLIGAVLPDEAAFTSVELDPESVRVARAVVEHAGLGEWVAILNADSKDAIEMFEEPFDLVFLDHWKDVYLRDLQALIDRKLLKPGCVVFADNVGPRFEQEAYLDFVRTCGLFDSTNRKGHIEYMDVEDAVEISVFKG